MSFAFLPLYTGDYRRDTQHLSPLRHGVYLLLLFHCWDTRGPVPLDEQEGAGIANCRSTDEVDALRYILTRFFVRMEDGWYNERMQLEIERAENISGARSVAGKKGYEARANAIAKQVLSNCQASASTPTPTTTLTPTTTSKKEKDIVRLKPNVDPLADKKSKVKSGLQEDALAILDFLNDKAGRVFRSVPANIEPILNRLREGFTAAECRQVIAKKVREWGADDKMHAYLRPKTLFTRTNFANYAGELVAPKEDDNG